jgi:DNA processing protein
MTSSPTNTLWATLSCVHDLTPKQVSRRLAAGESLEEIARGAHPGLSCAELSQKLAALQAHFVGRTDAEFPTQRLADLGENAPLGLYLRGTLGLNEALAAPCVAIVGTRRATDYGKRTSKRLAEELAARGATIISGMALGIDAAAHVGALEASGKTIGILGPGVDAIYPPENRELFERMAHQGLLLSEMPPGRAAEPYLFPLRNRLICGLSHAVVVVESDIKGGAMITAGLALKQGRRLMAVPGRIDQRTSAGPNRLIHDGARAVTCAQDILEALAPTGDQTEMASFIPAPLPANLPAFLQPLLEGEVLSAEELATRTHTPACELLPKLLELELTGRLAKNLDATYEWRG